MEETIEDLKKRKDEAFKGWTYAIERIDVLIISISGGGVYICLDAMKHLSEMSFLYLIKSSGALFAFAIVLNVISQWTGKKSNLDCYKSLKERLKPEDSINKQMVDESRNSANLYDDFTEYLNIGSIIAMLVSLICLVVYFFITF